MMTGDGLPAVFGTEVVSGSIQFSPAETVSSTSIRRGAK